MGGKFSCRFESCGACVSVLLTDMYVVDLCIEERRYRSNLKAFQLVRRRCAGSKRKRPIRPRGYHILHHLLGFSSKRDGKIIKVPPIIQVLAQRCPPKSDEP